MSRIWKGWISQSSDRKGFIVPEEQVKALRALGLWDEAVETAKTVLRTTESIARDTQIKNVATLEFWESYRSRCRLIRGRIDKLRECVESHGRIFDTCFDLEARFRAQIEAMPRGLQAERERAILRRGEALALASLEAGMLKRTPYVFDSEDFEAELEAMPIFDGFYRSLTSTWLEVDGKRLSVEEQAHLEERPRIFSR